VGLALDRARAVEDREELAVLSDRDRIARDLHDLVIQRLFATGMQLQGVRMLADRGDLVAEIDNAVDNIDITIKEIRGSIFELQGRRDASLRGDLRRLVKEFVPALGFAPSVRTVGPVDTAVPDEVQGELLAVLQEALSNVAQHARAKQAAVEVEVSAGEVVVRGTDDGVGLPEERFESGLRNARSRAAALHGSFAVAPGSLRGTVFTWRVPLT
jgi:signal transduction histidine kinase